MNYLIDHPIQIINFIQQIFTTTLINVFNGVFNFYNGKLGAHYQDHYVFITVCLQIFLAFVLLIYPEKSNLKLKTKIGTLLTLLIIYIGTCFIQLLTWAYVGQMGLGVTIRYFIPLFMLVPIISADFIDFKKYQLDKYVMVCIIGFLAALIISFATKYY